jgi:hypothetical protein
MPRKGSRGTQSGKQAYRGRKAGRGTGAGSAYMTRRAVTVDNIARKAKKKPSKEGKRGTQSGKVAHSK